MDRKKMLMMFWTDVAAQNDARLRNYFAPNAYIRWNNTNEQFTVEEYIIANCEYPGEWCGEVERIELIGDLAVTATRVWSSDNSASFHVCSFFEFQGEKISVLNEYWGDDDVVPQWRIEKHIGRSIT